MVPIFWPMAFGASGEAEGEDDRHHYRHGQCTGEVTGEDEPQLRDAAQVTPGACPRRPVGRA